MAKSEVTLRFQLFDCTRNEQIYFRMTRSDTSVGPLLESLAVIFLENLGIHKRPTHALKGPQAKEIEARLEKGVKESKHLSPFCLPLEIEQLAAWSLLRMIEINEAPKPGEGFDKHFSFMVNPKLHNSDTERPIVVPSILKKFSMERKRGEARCVPLNYTEFAAKLKEVNAQFQGTLKDYTNPTCELMRYNSAICALTDTNRGIIPLAVKSALFLTPPVPERKIAEIYHREVSRKRDAS
eukprot:Gregarina_sp_Poly_1__10636@NODE_79_length_15751_cov_81_561464_g67_i0_p7_GENE_NODE_79_length_15751_cov_81_561464_g67_i0NODE_79_length_15751_cov_81_561464_g67_i0_p7_ORF_typecomplete_len239_score36_89_NODE_79_length_15751_cov_81_561464_g67_i08011517